MSPALLRAVSGDRAPRARDSLLGPAPAPAFSLGLAVLAGRVDFFPVAAAEREEACFFAFGAEARVEGRAADVFEARFELFFAM